MSHLKELFCCLVVLCVSILPVLPQNCDQFTIQPAVGPNMPLVIREGGGAMLTCFHVSSPPFILHWYRDTTAIREDNADTLDECSCQVPRVEFMSGNNRTVTFMNFARQFAGEYSCRAPITSGIFDICRFNILAAEAPSIRYPVPEQNRTVQIDGTLTIPVIVDGVPSPTITWRNGSTELVYGSGRVGVSDTGALTVTGVTQNDRGNYSLSLSNTGGNLTRYFSVFVPFVEIPRISNPEVNGDQIRVTCIAVGYPTTPSVEWRDSSGSVINSNEYAANVLTPGTYEMMLFITVSVSRFNCRGTYSCSATNTIQGSRVTLHASRNFCNEVPPPPPQPMNVMITQNGADSVRVSWIIDTSNTEATFVIDICYTPSGGSEVCLGEGSTLPKTATSTTIRGLEVGVNYAFSVISVTTVDRNESTGRSVVLSPCSGEVIVQVLGVSVNTAVTDGERTFNITWREAQDSNSVVTGYKVMETKSRWESIVADRTITSLTTPANFCNGEVHSFVVMAFDNCGSHGPPSTPVIGKCGNSSCGDGDVQLVGGNSEREGRVEICYNGVWGTVCDYGWDQVDANVVCQQLGYGQPATVSHTFGVGEGPTLLFNVTCNHTHSELSQCVHPDSISLGDVDCVSQDKRAGVICPELIYTVSTQQLIFTVAGGVLALVVITANICIILLCFILAKRRKSDTGLGDNADTPRPEIGLKENEAYGQLNDGIETEKNDAYGQATQNITTQTNEAYGQLNDGIETEKNDAYGQVTQNITTQTNEAYGENADYYETIC